MKLILVLILIQAWPIASFADPTIPVPHTRYNLDKSNDSIIVSLCDRGNFSAEECKPELVISSRDFGAFQERVQKACEELTFRWRREGCISYFRDAVDRLEKAPSAPIDSLGNIGVEEALREMRRH